MRVTLSEIVKDLKELVCRQVDAYKKTMYRVFYTNDVLQRSMVVYMAKALRGAKRGNFFSNFLKVAGEIAFISG